MVLIVMNWLQNLPVTVYVGFLAGIIFSLGVAKLKEKPWLQFVLGAVSFLLGFWLYYSDSLMGTLFSPILLGLGPGMLLVALVKLTKLLMQPRS